MSKRKQPNADSPLTSPLSSKFKIENPNDVSVWTSVVENDSLDSSSFIERESNEASTSRLNRTFSKRVKTESQTENYDNFFSQKGGKNRSSLIIRRHNTLIKMPEGQKSQKSQKSSSDKSLSSSSSITTPNIHKNLPKKVSVAKKLDFSTSSIPSFSNISNSAASIDKYTGCNRRRSISKLPINRTKHDQSFLKKCQNSLFGGLKEESKNESFVRPKNSQNSFGPLASTNTSTRMTRSKVRRESMRIQNQNKGKLLESNVPRSSLGPAAIKKLTVDLKPEKPRTVAPEKETQNNVKPTKSTRSSLNSKKSSSVDTSEISKISTNKPELKLNQNSCPRKEELFIANLLSRTKYIKPMKWCESINYFSHFSSDELVKAESSLPEFILDFYVNIGLGVFFF